MLRNANVAQSVEQRFRKPQVKGSSPFIGSIFRGVAQFGSAFGSGPKGRRFKSCHLDHSKSGSVLTESLFSMLHGLKKPTIYRFFDSTEKDEKFAASAESDFHELLFLVFLAFLLSCAW